MLIVTCDQMADDTPLSYIIVLLKEPYGMSLSSTEKHTTLWKQGLHHHNFILLRGYVLGI